MAFEENTTEVNDVMDTAPVDAAPPIDAAPSIDDAAPSIDDAAEGLMVRAFPPRQDHPHPGFTCRTHLFTLPLAVPY